MRVNPEIQSSLNKLKPLSLIELAEGLKDALAPARCIQCLIEGTWYCGLCRNSTPPHVLTCIICKQERPAGRTCVLCREETSITGIVSAGAYSNQPLQRGIEWLKFKGIRPLAEILGALLIPRIASIAPLEYLAKHAVLVPLPLHTWRKRTRGFNQSEDIANAIGRICTIQVAHILKRTAATSSQANLPHTLRAQNMENAFSLAISKQEYIHLIQKKPNIIIIDDVATTGSTLSSAACALPSIPGMQIWGAVVARG